MRYQDDYQKAWEDAGAVDCKWDSRDTPYHWWFGAKLDGRPFAITIPAVEIAIDTGGGMESALDDIEKLREQRRAEEI